MSSCWGCKYLYSVGAGYSNYTWLDDEICCALNKNPNLPAVKPYDWQAVKSNLDNWPKTQNTRCESYTEGPFIELDVDEEDGPACYTSDEEVINLICADTGRTPRGGY
jgi:hypothetical protein